MMKMFRLANFIHEMPIREAIRELDYVLDAVWSWERSQHGPHEYKYSGRAVYEAVCDLQEWLITEDK